MKSVLSLLQFTTILPLGKPQDFNLFARHSWMFPVAGYVIALLVAIPVFFIRDTMLASAVAVAGVIVLSGAHHLDGLLDLGDGLMAQGDKDKRVRALTDKYVGAGGIAAGLVVTLLLFAGLHAAASLISVLIIGEVAAKFSMSFLTAYGTPFKEGMHSYLHRSAKPYFPFLSFLLCIPLILLPVSPFRLVVALTVMILCPVGLLILSERLFGGVNGDVVGAANEITRALVVVALALI
ncbi:adenosylcobinamide-GDP ribazoletransferase [Methanoregula sp.]|uniref:adenosylcobinamide-GDP ribazoletransferase n=1 Tax=Methanoregula sp. TaxID=2052170 RepID=UPI002CA4475D|nr:adenosylcobinamide-GDP ribazoletransferase [Methanoregula sp.]HVP96669.1 adenosylcobinamide-GDP ribazoletransferase [Methanoregula sp.]